MSTIDQRNYSSQQHITPTVDVRRHSHRRRSQATAIRANTNRCVGVLWRTNLVDMFDLGKKLLDDGPAISVRQDVRIIRV